MNNSGNSTHKARAADPQTFRAAATGVGSSFRTSVCTGAQRALYSIDGAPPNQRRAIPLAEGFPTPSPTYNPATGEPVSATGVQQCSPNWPISQSDWLRRPALRSW